MQPGRTFGRDLWLSLTEASRRRHRGRWRNASWHFIVLANLSSGVNIFIPGRRGGTAPYWFLPAWWKVILESTVDPTVPPKFHRYAHGWRRSLPVPPHVYSALVSIMWTVQFGNQNHNQSTSNYSNFSHPPLTCCDFIWRVNSGGTVVMVVDP